jgi:protein-S-isoprenylcysteine O-methyltransferase Ste14
MLTSLTSALLFLHAVPAIAFLACSNIAYKKAIQEEELLASEDGFGQNYRDYTSKTGRFLPRLGRRRGQNFAQTTT